jgi:ActR/RegA family two-component response regulator
MMMQAKQSLVVEDERFLHSACAASLHQRGWTVLAAVDVLVKANPSLQGLGNRVAQLLGA